MLDDADRIWNRACDPFAALDRPGDEALQAVLRVHGQVMNGGIGSALEYQEPERIRAAVAGLRYLGMQDAANALAEALSATDDAALERLDDRYNAAVPRDAALEAAFRRRLREAPADFAPPAG